MNSSLRFPTVPGNRSRKRFPVPPYGGTGPDSVARLVERVDTVPEAVGAMRELDARPVHRVKGRPALLRRLRGLLVAAHRFGRHRATSPAERLWAARLVDGLTTTVGVCDPGSVIQPDATPSGGEAAGRSVPP